MKRNIFYSAAIVALTLLLNLQVNAQVAINTTGSGPDGSAILDLTNTEGKGLLIPAIDDVTTVQSPAQHLFMYQTGSGNQGPGLYYFEGSSWTRLASGGGSISAVTATSPLSSSGGSAPDISIPVASTTSDGYLSKDDYLRFDAIANVPWTPGTGTNTYYNPGGNAYVSIGTATPSNKLYVLEGSTGKYVAYFENSANTSTSHGIQIKGGSNSATGANLINFLNGGGTQIGKIWQSGTTAISLVTSSDARLKNSIKNTNFSIDNLLKIKVRDFYWNEDPSKKLNTGFIAQELYEVYPNAVALPASPEETWMISKEELVPLIVKSIQDQQAIIKAQEERIKSLEERLSALEQKLSK